MRKLVLRGFPPSARVRALLTGIAIALGVALMAGTYVLTDTINRSFAEVFATSYANKAVVVTAKEVLGRGDRETWPISEATCWPACARCPAWRRPRVASRARRRC